MTNFERIKAMTLEELADEICDRFIECSPACPGYDLCERERRGTLVYLKQESEVE